MAWSSPKWCQSFVLRLCWQVMWLFSFVLPHLLKLRGEKPFYWWKFKMVRLVRKWCQSFVLRLCWQDMCFFFRLCSIRSLVMDKFLFSRSRMLLLRAAGEMKIQNTRMEPTIMSIVCAVIFFVCATPPPKLGAKTPPIHGENYKLSVRAQNGVSRFFFVCAGGLCDLLRLCYSPSQTGGQNPSYIWWKLKMVRFVRKQCQSFVLRLCWRPMWFFR